MTAEAVLARLAAATDVTVEVRSGALRESGSGAVEVECDGSAVVLWESGAWAPGGGRLLRWRSSSRWWAEGGALAVEHARQGVPASAVLDGAGSVWTGRQPHVCGADLYSVSLRVGAGAVEVAWDVAGPHKAGRVVTRFR